jgi:hypothetical protein
MVSVVGSGAPSKIWARMRKEISVAVESPAILRVVGRRLLA